MSETFIEGGCLCGSIRYRAKGKPENVTHCHCLHCRGASAAAFVTWATFESDDFAITQGEPAQYSSRPGVIRTFCDRCGTPLTYRSQDSLEWDVTVCSMDDPETVAPQDHTWAVRQIDWAQLDDGLPRYKKGRSSE